MPLLRSRGRSQSAPTVTSCRVSLTEATVVSRILVSDGAPGRAWGRLQGRRPFGHRLIDAPEDSAVGCIVLQGYRAALYCYCPSAGKRSASAAEAIISGGRVKKQDR